MISNECINEIGLFDENTFLYHEEVILGEVMNQKGFDTYYLTDSVVIHEHGQSTKDLKAFAYTCFVESEIYYLKKYMNENNFKILPLYLIRTIKYILQCLKSKDFRRNFKSYVFKTTYSLFHKDKENV